MKRQIHKGFMFINDLMLTSENKKPLGRIDESYTETISKKLKFVCDYANENELKIIVFGNVFKSGFESEALSLFVHAFKDADPIIIYNKKSESLEFFELLDCFEIINDEGVISSVNIESKTGVDEYDIVYYSKVDSAYSGLNMFDMSIDRKGILISDKFCPAEFPYDGIEAIVCGQWDSVSKDMSIKSHCPTIIRQSVKDKNNAPSTITWSPDVGFYNVEIQHEKEVFDDFDFSYRITENKASEFAEKLKISSQNSTSGGEMKDIVRKFCDNPSIKGDVAKEIMNLFEETS